MHEIIYIGIGGNLGQRHLFLAAACDHINAHIGPVRAKSRIYETAAWGMTNAPDFLNQVLEVETHLAPLEVLHQCLKIERLLGRKRRNDVSGYRSRTADIDLLMFGDLVFDHPLLQLPHPGIAKRRFVLEPLAELAANCLHPVHHQTIAAMLNACNDQTHVQLWPSPMDM
jgi:2-amino-4-hydroxy-6-hydroxymethyldihydropteridine diphosphokinase